MYSVSADSQIQESESVSGRIKMVSENLLACVSPSLCIFPLGSTEAGREQRYGSLPMMVRLDSAGETA